MENKPLLLLPPAKDGRLYYSYADLVRSQQLLRAFERLDITRAEYQRARDRFNSAEQSLEVFFLLDVNHFKWRELEPIQRRFLVLTNNEI